MSYYPQIVGYDPGAASRAASAANAGASMALARVAEARARAAELAQQGQLAQAQQLLTALQSNPSTAAQLALTRADVADVQAGLPTLDQRLQNSVAQSAPLPASVPLGGGLSLQAGSTEPRRETLPIPATLVGAGATADIIMTPQRPQRIGRLVVPSSIAAYFVIHDLEVAKDSQFTGSGSVPAEMFTEVGVDVSLKGSTAYPGVQIVLSVENIDGAPHTFRGGIIGPSLA